MKQEITSMDLKKLIIEEMKILFKEEEHKIIARAEKRLKELKKKDV